MAARCGRSRQTGRTGVMQSTGFGDLSGGRPRLGGMLVDLCRRQNSCCSRFDSEDGMSRVPQASRRCRSLETCLWAAPKFSVGETGGTPRKGVACCRHNSLRAIFKQEQQTSDIVIRKQDAQMLAHSHMQCRVSGESGSTPDQTAVTHASVTRPVRHSVLIQTPVC